MNPLSPTISGASNFGAVVGFWIQNFVPPVNRTSSHPTRICVIQAKHKGHCGKPMVMTRMLHSICIAFLEPPGAVIAKTAFVSANGILGKNERKHRQRRIIKRFLVLISLARAILGATEDSAKLGADMSCSVPPHKHAYCDGRGVVRLGVSGDEALLLSEVEKFVDRNEPFVWRHCLTIDSLSWWNDDDNIASEEANTTLQVRMSPRTGRLFEATTEFLRYGGSPSARYRHENMTLREFFRVYEDSEAPDHVYAAQIDLAVTLPGLLKHLPAISTSVLTALGPPEQQTIYIGRGTKTQLHYDSRENLVCVLSGGSKIFTLYDPVTSAALLYLDANEYGNASPIDQDREQFPMAKYAIPTHVQLHAGDCLYLPIYWFHSVETLPQDPRTISVNWWRRPSDAKKDTVGRLLCGQSHRKASAKC